MKPLRWRFECPDCGYDDEEAGRLLSDDEVCCPLCFEDCLRAVRVIRWARRGSPAGFRSPNSTSCSGGVTIKSRPPGGTPQAF